MATPVYPGAVKTFTDKVDFVDDVMASTINEAYAEIIAIENEVNTHKAEIAAKHIKESGNNANGYYIKFDDGTMICYGNIPTAAIGASADTDFTTTYPATFMTISSFLASAIPDTTWNGFFVKGTIPNPSSPLTNGFLHIINGTTAQNFSGKFIVIGRWK